MREKKNAYNILVGTTELKRQLGTHRNSWRGNIGWTLWKWGEKHELDASGSG
jgi:hypothetical protein